MMALQGKKIAFLGAGNMGEAMIRGLLKAGLSAPEDILAADLRADHLQVLHASLGVRTTTDPVQAAVSSQILVLAVKPQAMPALLASLAGKLHKGQLAISIAAGVRLETMQVRLGELPLIRVMPNTPGLLGQGASCYCLGTFAGREHGADAEALLASLGLVLRVDESQMDAVTALSGSGPAYVFLFMEALQAAGEELGLDPETSFRLAAQTLKGAAAMIDKREESPQRLREKVTSPGGTTAAALKTFNDNDFQGLVLKAMTAARDRSMELGKA
jgi:pyrroline-5-carboxylate reductase